MIHAIQNDLRKIVNLYKEKPYLPFWGELFYVLQKLKTINENTNHNLFLYETEASASIFYQQSDGRFLIMLPNFNILLTQAQFIDNILEGRFWPK